MDALELAGIIRDQVDKAVDQRIAGLRSAFELSVKAIPPGVDGRHGIDGKDGRDGVDGKDGSPGVGIKGDRGDQGEKGDQGEAGKDGAQGLRGEPGQPGDRGEPGAKGDQGESGKDGAPGSPGLKGDTGERGIEGPAGKDGGQGIQGKDGAPGARGDDGQNGAKGDPGERGEKGDTGLQGKDGAPGKEGQKGIDGAAGKDGAPGERGERGEKGMDGKSVTLDEIRPIFEGEVAKWALDFERRAADTMQREFDKMPRPKDGVDGKGGVDALDLDDFKAESKDGGRVLVLKLARGDREIVREVKLDVIIDRGLYSAGRTYEKGDCITWAGSSWIAQNSISKPPGDQDPGWRLSVKRGQNGKDADK